ncbi:hypothetical protein O3P69_017792 [Scylla paramamosain]|uniref:Uncharacterized protein n=1 Tax=Scylla paramamosain TaxID=85552 RepID=A0AAW0SE43_SCYPA
MEVIKYNDFSNARLPNSRRQWCDMRSNLITLSSLVGCWRWREHGLCLWWHHCRRWQARRSVCWGTQTREGSTRPASRHGVQPN